MQIISKLRYIQRFTGTCQRKALENMFKVPFDRASRSSLGNESDCGTNHPFDLTC